MFPAASSASAATVMGPAPLDLDLGLPFQEVPGHGSCRTPVHQDGTDRVVVDGDSPDGHPTLARCSHAGDDRDRRPVIDGRERRGKDRLFRPISLLVSVRVGDADGDSRPR